MTIEEASNDYVVFGDIKKVSCRRNYDGRFKCNLVDAEGDESELLAASLSLNTDKGSDVGLNMNETNIKFSSPRELVYDRKLGVLRRRRQ